MDIDTHTKDVKIMLKKEELWFQFQNKLFNFLIAIKIFNLLYLMKIIRLIFFFYFDLNVLFIISH